MPPDAALAEVAWDASAAPARKERRKVGATRSDRKRRVNAASVRASRRPRRRRAARRGQERPGVAARVCRPRPLRRAGAAVGPRLPHRLFLRRRALPPVRRGAGAHRTCLHHRVPGAGALHHPGLLHGASPAAAPADGLDRDGRAAAGGGLLPEARARVFPRLAGAVVRGRRRCAARLSRRRRGADAAGPRQGPPHAPRHRLWHRPRQREPAEGARRRSAQRHPRLRRVRRSRRRPGRPLDRRLSQPRQPRGADALLPARAHRHAGRGAAAVRGEARARAHQEAVGAARSTSGSPARPPRSGSARAPIPSPAPCR